MCAARYGDFEKGSIIGIRQDRVQRPSSDRFTQVREEGQESLSLRGLDGVTELGPGNHGPVLLEDAVVDQQGDIAVPHEVEHPSR